jgi:hypothetical protein
MARATPGPSFAEQIVEALKQKSRPEPHSGKLATAKRKRPGETVGEQRLKMVEQAGMSIEQVAKKDGYREDVIERSLLRAAGEPLAHVRVLVGSVVVEDDAGSVDSLKRRSRCGASPAACQIWFAAKVEDVVGLYVAPPKHAVVLSADEKAQIQALDRTQPGLPMKPGRLGTMTHDYKRHGTTTLFAALNVLEGTVIGCCMQRHRHQEFVRFLNAVERVVPAGKVIHVRRGLLRQADPAAS